MEYQDLYREHKGSSTAENRITNILLRHWNDVRSNKLLPSEKDLDANILEEILDNCFLINITEFARLGTYKYIYIGNNILHAYASNTTVPHDYHDVNPLFNKNKFEEAISSKKPVIDEGDFTNKDGHLVKYRQCFLPLGKDGKTTESIFGGMRFKILK